MAVRGWLWICLGAACCSLTLGQNQIVEVAENIDANLPCKALAMQGGTQKRVEWKFQKGSTTVLFYHDGQFTDDYKNRAVFYPSEIQLKKATRKDSGIYICEVLGSTFSHSQVELVVQVPPSKPQAQVPTMVTIGTKAVLTCVEAVGNPRPTFKWFKNDMEVPLDPKTVTLFRNSSYTLDPKTGELTFEPAAASDAGDYYCEAQNKVGGPARSDTVRMNTSEVNVGAIVAAVVVLLLVLGLVIFGVWFAYSRGFFSRRKDTANKKVIYSQPSNRSDGEFKQTSSFLV